MIKFLEIKAINDSFEPQLSQAIKRVLDSGWYLLGNEVKAFEQELPVEIWKRKKQGFTFPFEGWLRENEFIMPSSGEEKKLYKAFQNRRLSWGRYWCALLMNRFSQKTMHAAA